MFKLLIASSSLVLIASTALAGGGPHDRIEKPCNPRPKTIYPVTQIENSFISVTDFESEVPGHFAIAEQFIGQRTQFGNCGSTLKILSPKTHVLIYQEFSKTYQQTVLIRTPIREDQLIVGTNSTAPVGATVRTDSGEITVSCDMYGEEKGTVIGTMNNRAHYATKTKCVRYSPLQGD